MLADRNFFISLIMSTLIHSLIFLNFNCVRPIPPLKKDLNKLKVSYFKLQKDISLLQKTFGGLKKISQDDEDSLENKPQLPKINNKDLSRDTRISKALDMDIPLDKPQTKSPNTNILQAAELKKVQIPSLGEKDKLIPGLENYYNVIRNKIKQTADKKFEGDEEGIVYVSFVVMADGRLNDIRIVEEKSVSSPYLRDIAIQSIKDASPYPAFPKEVSFSILSIKIPISFERSFKIR